MVNILKDKKYLTSEEAIEAIVEEFTPEQLDVLEITSQLGRKISFKDQLDAHYGHYYPTGNCRKIKNLTAKLLLKPINKETLENLSICFQKENPEKISFEQEEKWKLEKTTFLQNIKKNKWNIAIIVLNIVAIIAQILIAIFK